MKVRQLSVHLQSKAIEELKEVPEKVEDDVKAIKNWLNEQLHITSRTDDQWIVTFLRGTKHNMEKCKRKLDSFYHLRTSIPELFANRDPLSPEIQRVFSAGVIIPLPKIDDAAAPRVFLLRTAFDASVIKPDHLFKALFMVLDIFLNEDDNFVVSGVHFISDVGNITLTHFFVSPNFFRKGINCLERVYPIRLKSVNVINQNSIFEAGFKILEILLPTKMLERFHYYRKESMSDLYKIAPKYILPTEYGGDGEALQVLKDKIKQKVENYKDWFENDAKFCANEDIRPKPAYSLHNRLIRFFTK